MKNVVFAVDVFRDSEHLAQRKRPGLAVVVVVAGSEPEQVRFDKRQWLLYVHGSPPSSVGGLSLARVCFWRVSFCAFRAVL